MFEYLKSFIGLDEETMFMVFTENKEQHYINKKDVSSINLRYIERGNYKLDLHMKNGNKITTFNADANGVNYYFYSFGISHRV